MADPRTRGARPDFAGQLDCPMPFAPTGTLTGRRYLDATGQLWPPEWEWPVWNHDHIDDTTNELGVKPGESDPSKGLGFAILWAFFWLVFFAGVVAFAVYSWLA